MQKKTWILIATMALSLNAAFADPVEPKEDKQEEQTAQADVAADVNVAVTTEDCSVEVQTECKSCH